MRKKQIIDKIVNDLPMSDIIGKMTKEEWYGWFEECWDKAINNTRCCEELKDKKVLTFEEWLSHFKKEDGCYWLNKETLYCKEAMKLHYDDLPDV